MDTNIAENDENTDPKINVDAFIIFVKNLSSKLVSRWP